MKIPIPREHGTWAMLYAPFLTALAMAGRVDEKAILLFLSITAVFFLREPLEALIRLLVLGAGDPDRKIFLARWLAIDLLAALLPGVFLIFHYRLWILSLFVILFGLTIALHLYLTFRRADRTMGAELMAVAALTSSGPATIYVMTGRVNGAAILLWVMNILFFSSSVFYVKMRVSSGVRKKNSQAASHICMTYHIALLVAVSVLALSGNISWLAASAFLPIILRALQGTRSSGKLNLKRIGIAEVAYTVLFVALLIGGMVL